MFKIMRVRDWLIAVFILKTAVFVGLTSGWLTILPSVAVVAAAFSMGRWIGWREREDVLKKSGDRRTVANMLYEQEVNTLIDRQRIQQKAQDQLVNDNLRPHGGGE